MRHTLLIALLAVAAPLTASAQVVSINIGWASPPPIVGRSARNAARQ